MDRSPSPTIPPLLLIRQNPSCHPYYHCRALLPLDILCFQLTAVTVCAFGSLPLVPRQLVPLWRRQ